MSTTNLDFNIQPDVLLATQRCPQCHSSTNSNSFRLIFDTCGHQKCRNCFLKEEDGCNACGEEIRLSENEFLNNIKHNSLNLKTIEQEEIAFNPENFNTPPNVRETKSNSKKEENIKRNKIEIASHISIIEGQPVQYRCNICNKTFKAFKHVRYHRYCASGEKPFKCSECDKTFSSSSHYKYHLLKHSGEKPFKCDVCSKDFIQKSKLQRHMITHSDEKPFVCQTCGKTYKSLLALNYHSSSHNPKKIYHCSKCNKKFADKNSLKHHKICHKGEFMCDNCGKIFNYKSSLKLHIATHSIEKPHICIHCDRGFSNKKDLKRHIAIHSNDRPFECTICKATFSRKDNLERHMRNPHDGAPPKIRSKRSDKEITEKEDPTKPSFVDELDLRVREKEITSAYSFRPVPLLIHSKETNIRKPITAQQVPVVVEAPRTIKPPASNQVKVIQTRKPPNEIHWKKRMEDANKKDFGINTIVIRHPSVIVNEQDKLSK